MTIREMLESLAQLVGGKAEGLETGLPRIYLPSGRPEVEIYFEFPDACYRSPDDPENGATTLDGARLDVRINSSGLGPERLTAERVKIAEQYLPELLAIMAWQAGDKELAEELLDLEEWDSDSINQMARHLANGNTKAVWEMLSPIEGE